MASRSSSTLLQDLKRLGLTERQARIIIAESGARANTDEYDDEYDDEFDDDEPRARSNANTEEHRLLMMRRVLRDAGLSEDVINKVVDHYTLSRTPRVRLSAEEKAARKAKLLRVKEMRSRRNTDTEKREPTAEELEKVDAIVRAMVEKGGVAEEKARKIVHRLLDIPMPTVIPFPPGTRHHQLYMAVVDILGPGGAKRAAIQALGKDVQNPRTNRHNGGTPFTAGSHQAQVYDALMATGLFSETEAKELVIRKLGFPSKEAEYQHRMERRAEESRRSAENAKSAITHISEEIRLRKQRGAPADELRHLEQHRMRLLSEAGTSAKAALRAQKRAALPPPPPEREPSQEELTLQYSIRDLERDVRMAKFEGATGRAKELNAQKMRLVKQLGDLRKKQAAEEAGGAPRANLFGMGKSKPKTSEGQQYEAEARRLLEEARSIVHDLGARDAIAVYRIKELEDKVSYLQGRLAGLNPSDQYHRALMLNTEVKGVAAKAPRANVSKAPRRLSPEEQRRLEMEQAQQAAALMIRQCREEAEHLGVQIQELKQVGAPAAEIRELERQRRKLLAQAGYTASLERRGVKPRKVTPRPNHHLHTAADKSRYVKGVIEWLQASGAPDAAAHIDLLKSAMSSPEVAYDLAEHIVTEMGADPASIQPRANRKRVSYHD